MWSVAAQLINYNILIKSEARLLLLVHFYMHEFLFNVPEEGLLHQTNHFWTRAINISTSFLGHHDPLWPQLLHGVIS